MMRSTGLVLAAGAIAAANETIFAPIPANNNDPAGVTANAISSFNWRLVPATGVLAITLGALEKAAPDFAVGLAGMVLLAVLIVPVGNAPTPVDNIIRTLGLAPPAPPAPAAPFQGAASVSAPAVPIAFQGSATAH